MSFIKEFKQELSFDKRKEESEYLKKKYSDRYPIICETYNDLKIEKNKYLVPKNIPMGNFIYTIRKKIKLNSNEGIFALTENNIMFSMQLLVSEIYKEHKANDGFLYIILSKENTFGVNN